MYWSSKTQLSGPSHSLSALTLALHYRALEGFNLKDLIYEPLYSTALKNSGKRSTAIICPCMFLASIIVCAPDPQPIYDTLKGWSFGKFRKLRAVSVSFSLPCACLSGFFIQLQICYLLILLIIKVAKNVSKTLRGMAKTKIPKGKTLIFPVTIHMSTKPINQAIAVVCVNENFFEIA